MIATNTIGQGDTRATGLTTILASGGSIIRAVRRLKWPGEAIVIVSVVHVINGQTASPILDDRQVRRISAYLVDGDLDRSPARLAANSGKAFQGSIVLGMGFTFDDEAAAKGTSSSLSDMKQLVAKNPTNSERIFPYIGGEEVNNHPGHAHRRYVIDFAGMSEETAREGWPDLLEIVERLVKPQRDQDAREARRLRWWRHGDRQPGLYAAIAGLEHVLAILFTAPHLAVARLGSEYIFANTLNIFALPNLSPFAVLQSRTHEIWARFFSSSMKDDLRYTPSDSFTTFPVPAGFEDSTVLERIARAYFDHRAALMIARNEGLTKTYNRFHKPTEKSADIVMLRELHAEMDVAVLRAYGWDDLVQIAKAEFIELPTDPGKKPKHRLFWPTEVQDEALKRLLALNAERAEADKRAGLSTAAPVDDAVEIDSDLESDEVDEDEDEA